MTRDFVELKKSGDLENRIYELQLQLREGRLGETVQHVEACLSGPIFCWKCWKKWSEVPGETKDWRRHERGSGENEAWIGTLKDPPLLRVFVYAFRQVMEDERSRARQVIDDGEYTVRRQVQKERLGQKLFVTHKFVHQICCQSGVSIAGTIAIVYCRDREYPHTYSSRDISGDISLQSTLVKVWSMCCQVCLINLFSLLRKEQIQIELAEELLLFAIGTAVSCSKQMLHMLCPFRRDVRLKRKSGKWRSEWEKKLSKWGRFFDKLRLWYYHLWYLYICCIYYFSLNICDIGMVQLSNSKHLVACRKAMEDEQSRAKQVMDDGEVSVQRQIEDQRRQLQAEMLVTRSIGGNLTSGHVETEIKVPT